MTIMNNQTRSKPEEIWYTLQLSHNKLQATHADSDAKLEAIFSSLLRLYFTAVLVLKRDACGLRVLFFFIFLLIAEHKDVMT